MHRTFQIQLPADKTPAVVADLLPLAGVIGLSVSPDSSRKPVGDTLMVQLLNKEADEVLIVVDRHCGEAQYLVTTSFTEAMIESKQAKKLEDDADEALWEEIESGMRHAGRISPNFVALMGLGGIMATVGILSPPTRQIMPFVAAAIIAPGFEPVAGMALSVVLHRWDVLGRALLSTLVGYTILAGASALTYWGLQWLGAVGEADFVHSEEIKHLTHPEAGDVLLSVCGALAGALIMSSFRKSVIAGALIAVVIINAAAAVGVGLACGRVDLAGISGLRFGADVVLILIGCGLVFWLKQRFFHQRRPVD
jgi:Domain of unknown function (DUF389)